MKIECRIEDLQPGEWFAGRWAEWQKVLSEWHQKHSEHKARAMGPPPAPPGTLPPLPPPPGEPPADEVGEPKDNATEAPKDGEEKAEQDHQQKEKAEKKMEAKH